MYIEIVKKIKIIGNFMIVEVKMMDFNLWNVVIVNVLGNLKEEFEVIIFDVI